MQSGPVCLISFFFFQAEDGIRDVAVTGVQTCALPILMPRQPTEPAPTPAPAPAHQMWGGRFSLGPSEALDALNRSLPVDHRLWPQDVAASKAWVHALGRVGVLTPGEETQLLEGLDRVAERLADGAAVGAPDEDVHTLVERDRKNTRLNSSHGYISYAVFCLKKKNKFRIYTFNRSIHYIMKRRI